MVRYHISNVSAYHEAYMRELGVWERCRYPGFFGDDRPIAFEALVHDLAFADDFLRSSGEVLQKAAEKEAVRAVIDHDRLMASAVGDTKKIEQLKARFHEKKYREVISIAAGLQYPDRLSSSELQMIAIARKRSASKTDAELTC
jgi:hypothetical protein